MLRVLFLVLAVAVPLATVAAADPPIAGISYNPSGTADFADMEKSGDPPHMPADLPQLQLLTHEVRIYAMGFGIDRLPAIAAQVGMKVTLGVWLGSDKARNADEVARALAAVRKNPATVTRIVVGNEALQHGY